MNPIRRIPPKCVISFHASLPIAQAHRLADSHPVDGSFYRYFQVRSFTGKRLRHVDVYLYTPIPVQ